MKSRPVDNFGMPPRLIDDTEIELEDGRAIGGGNFGSVMRALIKDKLRPQDPDQYVVVVKVSHQPDLKAQLAEYDALKLVEPHPNLCGLVGHMIHADPGCPDVQTLRFVLPYLGGGSLEQRGAAWFRADVARTVKATLDILRGLEALGKANLVHRDSTLDAMH